MRGRAIVPKGEYPADWRQIALATKEAAGWRCVRCDAAHSRHGWRILTVHHIDGDKGNCRWWNIAALCQRCHLSIQGRVNPNRPWVMCEHTEWFKPYAAGLYAFKYLGEDLTREQVMERLDELLRVEPRVVLGLGA